jgi:hypothetical protein
MNLPCILAAQIISISNARTDRYEFWLDSFGYAPKTAREKRAGEPVTIELEKTSGKPKVVRAY